MFKNCLFLLCCCCTLIANARQHGTIKGYVADATTRHPVAAATITLLQQKDSSLVSFTMSDNKGYFSLTGVTSGTYRLLITHVNYHATNRQVVIKPDAPTGNMDTILLYDRSTVLREVVVSGAVPPVTLIGDTIEYNSASFKTIPNATVEQLLKKLPGLEVDKNGTVKAQGQKVNRVLVDGKEFFGADPKMATKNLPADAVDKVQVYDRQSDVARLTGLDDGNSEKTVNLQLKPDKKKGLFGKAMAGGGTAGRYEGRFNVNSFKGNRQFSAIGMANNTNAEGFSFMDLMNFSGELNRLRQNGQGNINFTINADDPLAAFAGGNNNNGIKTIAGGGINYNNTLGKKTDITSNYFYNHYQPQLENTLQRHYFLPDSSYYYNQQSNTHNRSNSHRLNLGADIPLDSFHSLKVTATAGYQATRHHSNNRYETLTEKQQLINQGYSNNATNGQGTNFSSSLLFRKKFRRKGRTFSFQLQNSYNSSNSDGTLLSVNRFFNRPASLPDTDSIHQQNKTSGLLNSYTVQSVYTEPLSRRVLLEFSLSRSHTLSTSDKTTYDYDPKSGRYDRLNPALTNNFENTYGYTNAGLRLRIQRKKFSLAFGAAWQEAALKGKIIARNTDSVIQTTFYNILPVVRFKYDFTRYQHLNIQFNTTTNQPTLAQLQPVPDITDPLNISEGNPDLKQEVNYQLQLNFMAVNPFRNKNLFAFFTLQETQQKIVNYDTVDSLGVKRSRPVNVNGVYNITGNLQLSLPLRFVKGTLHFSANTGYSKNKQFINTVPNTIHTLRIGPSIRADLLPGDKTDLSFSAGIDYYSSTYSLQPALNTQYLSQQYEGNFNCELPANFSLSTSITYTINSRRAAGYNRNIPLWHLSVSRQFLRFKRAELKLSVYDLFNQNVGINRTSNQNYIEDSQTKNLQRFFQLGFTYSLHKNGLAANKQGEGIRIMRMP
ncbi:outer membrane beta-barrel protein [Chitinophaga nivalis]|uniref:Outer membrane beta-barrel protein n=1 Tax=Chitinophaga nivalis TaxID=2991709 RepID=A0ABT3IKK3_9BACT|nr:outer membrane beta-barrel protein [Chitinophaga nivalis]MCW3465817.1 outer membrane beta-barrel protein [Chitinophaga nivalis]MCW3484492.1 outer membrane beta-barrel protein [Chitinophaga nivalis]